MKEYNEEGLAVFLSNRTMIEKGATTRRFHLSEVYSPHCCLLADKEDSHRIATLLSISSAALLEVWSLMMFHDRRRSCLALFSIAARHLKYLLSQKHHRGLMEQGEASFHHPFRFFWNLLHWVAGRSGYFIHRPSKWSVFVEIAWMWLFNEYSI